MTASISVKRDRSIQIVNPRGAVKIVAGGQGPSGPGVNTQFQTYATAGDINISSDQKALRIKRPSPAAQNINMQTAAARNGSALVIADGDGSFADHPQTVVFTGGDTARGASSIILDSPWSVTEFLPQSDGTWVVG